MNDSDGHWTMSGEGPMSASGKPHGEWENQDLRAGWWDLPGRGESKTWYWYGEEITEGEWHLRNK